MYSQIAGRLRNSPLKPNGSHYLFPANPKWTNEDGKSLHRPYNFESRKPKRFRKLLPPQPNSPQMLYRARKKVITNMMFFYPRVSYFKNGNIVVQNRVNYPYDVPSLPPNTCTVGPFFERYLNFSRYAVIVRVATAQGKQGI